MTVLITDAQSRQGLATARSLGRTGIRVLAGDTERLTLTGCSHFVARHFTLPHPVEQEEEYVATLERIIADERCSMILPMTDRSLLAIAKHADRFRSVFLPFPDIATIMKARDKSQTMDLARKLAIPTPKSVVIRHADDFAKVKKFPCLLKPTQGSGSRGIRIVHSANALQKAAPEMVQRHGPFLAQEIIPQEGVEIGCYLLYGPDHTLIASMLQRRIRSFPAHGGPSTLRITMHDEQILSWSKRLAEHIGWKGPLMVEWKVDPRDKVPKLMEMNPRFWGSLEGSIAAGIDFPWLTYQAFSRKALPPSRYADGIRSRWMFPGDFLWMVTSGLSPRTMWAFLRAFGIHDDVWSWSDPLPFFGTVLIAIKHFLQPKKRKYFLGRK